MEARLFPMPPRTCDLCPSPSAEARIRAQQPRSAAVGVVIASRPPPKSLSKIPHRSRSDQCPTMRIVFLGSRSSLALLRRLTCRRSLRGLLFLGSITSRSRLRVTTIRRSPQCQVIPEQLHDQCAVAVGFFGKRVELGNRIVKGLLGKVAGTFGGVQNFVVENTEVQGKT